MGNDVCFNTLLHHGIDTEIVSKDFYFLVQLIHCNLSERRKKEILIKSGSGQIAHNVNFWGL